MRLPGPPDGQRDGVLEPRGHREKRRRRERQDAGLLLRPVRCLAEAQRGEQPPQPEEDTPQGRKHGLPHPGEGEPGPVPHEQRDQGVAGERHRRQKVRPMLRGGCP